MRAKSGVPSPSPTGQAEPDLSRSFAVVVHDVAPAFRPQLIAILDALSPRVGGKLIGAVVPCWHGTPLGGGEAVSDPGFLRLVGRAFGEILQHGHTHRQERPGVISFFSGRSNELSGLSIAETRRRLGRGREILRQALGVAVAGFVPPAWQSGQATTAELARLGFRYRVGLGAIRPADSPPIPLATWSWDWGIVASLGRVGEHWGGVSSGLRPDALPCVVVHPADVDRGYLPRVLRVVDRLRLRGRSPVTFSELTPPPTAETVP